MPVITGPSTWNVTLGQTMTVNYATTNADGSDVTLSVSGLPSTATFDPKSGLVTWTPATAAAVSNARSVTLIKANLSSVH